MSLHVEDEIPAICIWRTKPVHLELATAVNIAWSWCHGQANRRLLKQEESKDVGETAVNNGGLEVAMAQPERELPAGAQRSGGALHASRRGRQEGVASGWHARGHHMYPRSERGGGIEPEAYAKNQQH